MNGLTTSYLVPASCIWLCRGRRGWLLLLLLGLGRRPLLGGGGSLGADVVAGSQLRHGRRVDGVVVVGGGRGRRGPALGLPRRRVVALVPWELLLLLLLRLLWRRRWRAIAPMFGGRRRIAKLRVYFGFESLF